MARARGATAPPAVTGAVESRQWPRYQTPQRGVGDRGSGDPAVFCSAYVTDGWVDNANDTEPDCATNDTDDCGVCAGV